MKKPLIAIGCLGLMLSAQMVMGQGKGKGKAPAGNITNGKELFEANCGVCHNADTDERKMGPGLKTVFKREKLANEKAVNDESVIQFINEGGNGMPAFGDLLTGPEKTDIMAYLHSL